MNLVAEWIAYQKTQEEKYWDSADYVMTLASKQPEALWDFINATLDSPECDDVVLSNLAAGPLEDLMNSNGKEFIERVVDKARRSPRFNLLLGGVWQSGIEPEVWKKIENIRNKIW